MCWDLRPCSNAGSRSGILASTAVLESPSDAYLHLGIRLAFVLQRGDGIGRGRPKSGRVRNSSQSAPRSDLKKPVGCQEVLGTSVNTASIAASFCAEAQVRLGL